MYKTIVTVILAMATTTIFATQATPETNKTQYITKHAPVIIKSKDGKKEVITFVKKDKDVNVKKSQGLKAQVRTNK
jgi:hypothetical protein